MIFQQMVALRVAAWLFRSQRSEYYDYLSNILQQTQGRKTLKDIFWDDANRYGSHHPRGRLSRHWAQSYEENGGDLSACFDKTLPVTDVTLIAIGQQSGGGALESTLKEVARLSALQVKAVEQFMTTIAVGLMALMIFIVALMAIPLFTVPKLQEAFMIPEAYLGSLTQRLYQFSDWIAYAGWVALLGLGGSIYVFSYVLVHGVGKWRSWLDRLGIGKLYAQYLSIQTFSVLATILQPRGNIQVSLREAIEILIEVTHQRWLRSHLERMRDRIDEGYVGADTFDTGLLNQETYWYLRDMVETQGVDEGLRQTQQRMEHFSMKRLQRSATVWRWGLLLGALAGSVMIAFWHMAVVQEMKNALLSYYAY